MRIAWPVMAVLALTGCVTAQREDPQGTALESQSLGLTGEAIKPVATGWWKSFGDPQLDTLVDDAIRNAPSLSQALSRVRLAQAQNLAAGAADDPHFTLDGDESWQ